MGKSHIILGLGQGMINLFIADYFTIIQVSYLTTDDLMPTWDPVYRLWEHILNPHPYDSRLTTTVLGPRDASGASETTAGGAGTSGTSEDRVVSSAHGCGSPWKFLYIYRILSLYIASDLSLHDFFKMKSSRFLRLTKKIHHKLSSRISPKGDH